MVIRKKIDPNKLPVVSSHREKGRGKMGAITVKCLFLIQSLQILQMDVRISYTGQSHKNLKIIRRLSMGKVFFSRNFDGFQIFLLLPT